MEHLSLDLLMQYANNNPLVGFCVIIVYAVGYSLSWALFSYKTQSKRSFFINVFLGLVPLALVFLMLNLINNNDLTIERFNAQIAVTIPLTIVLGAIVFFSIICYKERKLADEKMLDKSNWLNRE